MKCMAVKKKNPESMLRLFSLQMWRDRENIIELFKILKGIIKLIRSFCICYSITDVGTITQN